MKKLSTQKFRDVWRCERFNWGIVGLMVLKAQHRARFQWGVSG
jgi:hypothetical protein